MLISPQFTLASEKRLLVALAYCSTVRKRN